MFAASRIVLVATLSLVNPSVKITNITEPYEPQFRIVTWIDPVLNYKNIITNEDLLEINLGVKD